MKLRRNSVALRVNPSIFHKSLYVNLAATIFLVVAVCACTSADPITPVSDPTQDLIVFTPTPEPAPATATITPEPPPSASDVLSTPTNVDALSGDEQAVILATAQDLSAVLNIPLSQVQRVLLEAVHWRGNVFDCESALMRLSTQGIAGFRVVYLVDDRVYVYRTDDEVFLQCDDFAVLDSPPDIFVAVDPIAADLVALAQRRLANQLDLSTRRIDVMEIRVRTWEDSSLGCPAAGQTYEQIETNGYRIALVAGEQSYVFHTSFDRLVLCETEEAQAGEGNG